MLNTPDSNPVRDAAGAEIADPVLTRPPAEVGDIIADLDDLVATLALAIDGLREQCGAGHERAFDAVGLLAQDVEAHTETLRAWANGRAARWTIAPRGRRVTDLAAHLEAAACARAR